MYAQEIDQDIYYNESEVAQIGKIYFGYFIELHKMCQILKQFYTISSSMKLLFLRSEH